MDPLFPLPRPPAKAAAAAASPAVPNMRKELESTKAHLEQLRRAVHDFHKAKGRHHSQIAAARLFELVGLPSQYPPGHSSHPQ